MREQILEAHSKEKAIGAICINNEIEERILSFEEILLDETLVTGKVWVKKEAIREVGGLNYRLHGKRNYELLLRVAQKYVVVSRKTEVEDWKEGERDAWICPEWEEWDAWSGVQADCYLIARYKDTLLDMDCFSDAVMGVLSTGVAGVEEYLEKMLAQTREYLQICNATQPILIYMGCNMCYGVLDAFARNLGNALECQGMAVIYLDFGESKRWIDDWTLYTQKGVRAIVAMQNNMFSVKLESGRFLHDLIDVPLFHFVFDHPIVLKENLQHTPKRECIMTLDRNYVRFIETYYGHSARFFPPAGYEKVMEEEKKYEISFLGTYTNDLLQRLWALRHEDKKRAHLISRYILYMRKHLNVTPEKALSQTLIHYGISYGTEEFLNLFHMVRWTIWGIANYYRSKIIEQLLNAGLTLHVFGDSWKKSPMWGHSGLIWHEAVIGDEAIRVYARSKISLNIMSWHKDGFTERIANAMLQKSVVVTDKTAYLEQNFEDGTELLMFDLAHIEKLPEQIKELLADEKRYARIAEAGYQKAVREHTWDKRAKKLLEWVDKDCSDRIF